MCAAFLDRAGIIMSGTAGLQSVLDKLRVAANWEAPQGLNGRSEQLLTTAEKHSTSVVYLLDHIDDKLGAAAFTTLVFEYVA